MRRGKNRIINNQRSLIFLHTILYCIFRFRWMDKGAVGLFSSKKICNNNAILRG